MNDITKDDIANVITGLSNGFDAELFAMAEEQLDGHWHFKFDPEKRFDLTLYDFFEMIKLYSGFCRRWEEYHNGTCCVVERVRDKYIMPKIKEFLLNVKAAADREKGATK